VRKALIIGGYGAAVILYLALLAPWYSTPRYCIELAGFSCPQSQSLGTDAQLALIFASVGFVAFLTLASSSRRRAAYFALVASALAVAFLVGYSAETKPDPGAAVSVGLDDGFYVAAVASMMMLVLSIALAVTARREIRLGTETST
jgi:hypothetical protein